MAREWSSVFRAGLRVCGLIAIVPWCGSWPAAGVILVKDGQPRSEIIMAEQPPRLVKLAADELRSYVEKISGAQLNIVTEPSGGDLLPVFVGKSAHTDDMKITDEGLAHGAFRIVVSDKAVVLLGHDADFTPPVPHARDNGDIPRATAEWDQLTGATWGFPHTQTYKGFQPELQIWDLDEGGSLHAVHELLRQLGVRWFMPGEMGEVVPKQATIALPTTDEVVRPDFALRFPYQYFKRFGMASTDETMWQLRLGISQAPEIIGLGEIGHGTRVVHERKEYREAHPDHFAMFGGKRETAGAFGSGKPCLSSPGLFEQNVRYVRAMFDIYDEPCVSVCPEDGYVAICQCELCAGKGTPERGWSGQISDYVWDYVNRVGQEVLKTHPDKKILCLAYGGYQAPPLKIDKLSPNILVGITQGRAGFYDPTEKQLYDDLRTAWLAKSAHPLIIWDYYLQTSPGNACEFMPVFFPHAIAADLRELKGKSFGDFIEVHRTTDGLQTLAANHLNLYTTSRYWWQADQDIEALLTDYFTKFYGPASDAMRAFVTHAEANWMHFRDQPDRIGESLALLAAARATVPTDSIYGRRIALIADYIQPMGQLRDQLARKRENVPHVQILMNDGPPIRVDGRLDEEVWQTGASHELVELETGRPPVFGAAVQAAWQGDNLLLGITCQERDTERLRRTTKENEDANIWSDDVIELLIETQVHSYYQIAISPNGAVTDLDRKRGLNTLWKSGVEVATQFGDGSWTMELQLPMADAQQVQLNPLDGVAGRLPSRTYPWYFNVCRQRVGNNGMERSALAPTGSDNFHVLDRYAILNLKPGGFLQDNPSLNPQANSGYVLQRRIGMQLIAEGKYAESLELFQQLAAGPLTDLQQADALEQASQCALRLNRPHDALTIAKRIRLVPYSKLATMRILSVERQWRQIADQFRDEDLNRWPDVLIGDAAFERGQAWFHITDGARAEKDLLLATDFTTDTNVKGECLLILGSTYRQQLGDDTQSIAAYRRVYQTGNEFKHCSAAVAIADILDKQGKQAEALAELERIDEKKMTIPVYRDMLLKAKGSVSPAKK